VVVVQFPDSPLNGTNRDLPYRDFAGPTGENNFAKTPCRSPISFQRAPMGTNPVASAGLLRGNWIGAKP
jgi:hypothetical protein